MFFVKWHQGSSDKSFYDLYYNKEKYRVRKEGLIVFLSYPSKMPLAYGLNSNISIKVFCFCRSAIFFNAGCVIFYNARWVI